MAKDLGKPATDQLNLTELPSWGSRSVDCFEKLEQIGEGTYGSKDKDHHCNMAANGGDMLESNDRLTSINYSTWKIKTSSCFDRHALDLVERMLTMDPTKRIAAKDALDAEYFWADPLPCQPSSLPKYESSHEYQTKKKRQQQRQQQDELAKRQKSQFQQPQSRLPPVQQPVQGHPSLRPVPGQSTHNAAPSAPPHHYGGGRGPQGVPNRHPQSGRPSHGSQSGSYNLIRTVQGSGYGGPSQQQGGAFVGQGISGQGGRGAGGYGMASVSSYGQVPYSGGGGRGPPMSGSGHGQQFGVSSQNTGTQPPAFGAQPYMQLPQQYVDMDNSYGRGSHTGFN